jgi:Ca-activated chloride channel family protein
MIKTVASVEKMTTMNRILKTTVAAGILLLVILLSFAERSASHIINGIVKVAGTQTPVKGATIRDLGGRKTVVTGTDGKFSITTNDEQPQIYITAVGYLPQTITVKSPDQYLEILLTPSTEKLEEVVVTGYSKKKNLTMEAPLPAQDALEGRVAGISVQRWVRKLVNQSPAIYGSRAPEYNTEEYDVITENRFLAVKNTALSTFSIDVDAASYSNLRRFLNQGQLPPAGVVRTEELINYFDYHYDQPVDPRPFAVHTELVECPWNRQHQLVSIGLQGKKIPVDNLPASNLVFLIDVSGSMEAENKLPLVKASLKMLTDQLREQDKVALVVYAGNAGMVLPATSGADKQKIKSAIDALEAGGSTAGGEGIQLAYKIARENFNSKGNNRVILCTDGDFNVGASSNAEMEKLIEQERKSGVFLTVLGFGMGNYKDSKMEILADKGNGNHAYIDGLAEAKKVLVSEFGGTLFTIAKDVKLQVEFNPANVQAYRLIGYENRLLNKEDFNNDQKDAGEMGSGHTVTALYEIIPTGVRDVFTDSVDALKYQALPQQPALVSNEVLQVKIRYKAPDSEKSELFTKTLEKKDAVRLDQASENVLFAAAVAEWGMLLNQSAYLQQSSFDNVLRLARKGLGADVQGYRKEFISLVKKSAALWAVKFDDSEDLSDLDR